MTSSERKIINCLWETKEKTHIRLVAQKANLSSDYARLLCRSLARSGHIKFENDLAHLLKKGRSRFENNEPVADELTAVAANITMLTDEPAVVSPASDRSDKEENQEEDAGEDKDKDEPASSDEELAPAAPLESSEETAVMKKEEKREKEDAAKPSSGSGWSFKKIVNWFAEKK